ncbi:unnamed protein product [Lampetra fluviatilis]
MRLVQQAFERLSPSSYVVSASCRMADSDGEIAQKHVTSEAAEICEVTGVRRDALPSRVGSLAVVIAWSLRFKS